MNKASKLELCFYIFLHLITQLSRHEYWRLNCLEKPRLTFP